MTGKQLIYEKYQSILCAGTYAGVLMTSGRFYRGETRTTKNSILITSCRFRRLLAIAFRRNLFMLTDRTFRSVEIEEGSIIN